MTVTLKSEPAEVKLDRTGGPVPMDNIDAMLRGRYSQEPLLLWVGKRIRHLYPK
ncbi:MAG: hypothetical protein AAF495_07345 [Pseudomonadota bacterium]